MNASQDTRKHHPRRILVVANETVEGKALREAIRFRSRDGGAEALVVAPALNTRLRHWTSDEDVARRAAKARLAVCLEHLNRSGVEARGVVGDADPLQAIADALHGFAANEIVIATHPEARSHWLGRDVVVRARTRFGLPVLHIVVDKAAGVEYIAERSAGARSSRPLVAALAALASVIGLVAAASAAGATTPTRLDGTVGPGFTITLRPRPESGLRA